MMIIRTHDRLLLGSDEADAEGDRKDEAVECTCKYEEGRRVSEDDHDRSRNDDESDDDRILVLCDRRMEGL